MRRVIASEMLSVEGFVEEEKGQLDWFVQDEFGNYSIDLDPIVKIPCIARDS